MPAASSATMFSVVPYLASAIARLGWSCQRKRTRCSKSSIARLSVTSAGVTSEEAGKVRTCLHGPANAHTAHRGVGADLGAIKEQLLTPNEARLVAQLEDMVEKALKEPEAQPAANPRQTRVVGQRFIEVIAGVPALGEIEGDTL